VRLGRNFGAGLKRHPLAVFLSQASHLLATSARTHRAPAPSTALLFVTMAIKAAGPATLLRRPLSPRAGRVIALVAPTVLCCLVVYETFATHPSGVSIDARTGGLVAAAVAIAARLLMFVVVVVGALATAIGRAVL
jgi:branched-subunit amino acid transport protein